VVFKGLKPYKGFLPLTALFKKVAGNNVSHIPVLNLPLITVAPCFHKVSVSTHLVFPPIYIGVICIHWVHAGLNPSRERWQTPHLKKVPHLLVKLVMVGLVGVINHIRRIFGWLGGKLVAQKEEPARY